MSTLLFNFSVDQSTNTIFITREFDAERSEVWDAFTKQEILDQWWAPEPLRSRTKHMDFRVGGRRFYAMVSPEGVELGWQIFEFTSITPKSNFKCTTFFTDKDEIPNSPGANWDLTFTEQPEVNGSAVTKLDVSIQFESFEEMQKMIEMGFKEGFTLILVQMASLLKTLKK